MPRLTARRAGAAAREPQPTSADSATVRSSSARAIRPTRSSHAHVRKLPGGSTRASEVGDGTPLWIRKAAGYSWRFLVLIAAVAIVVYGLLQVQVVFIAVFLALVVTSVLDPFVSWLARWMPRAIATVIALLAAIVFFAGLLTYVVYSVGQQWTDLGRQFNDGIEQIFDLLENGPLPITITADDINEWVDNGRQWLIDHSGELAGQVFANAGGVFEAFTILALGTFVTIFFLVAGGRMWRWFLNELPARSRLTVHGAAGAGWYTFAGYARGTVIIAVIDGILAYILLLVVGVPLAAPLAVLVFIGAFIPLVGAPAAMIVAAIVALAANGFWPAVIVTIGIAGIGQVEGHILQPLIMGRQVSLHPVAVALGVTAGTFLGGLLGAVIAIPLIAVVWTVYSKLHAKDPPLEGPLPSVREVASKDNPAVG